MTPRRQTGKIIILAATSLTLLFGCNEAKHPGEDTAISTSEGMQNTTPSTTSTTLTQPQKRVQLEKKALPAPATIASPATKQRMHETMMQQESEADIAYAGDTYTPLTPINIQDKGNHTPNSFNTESYTPVQENRFISTLNDQLSTFSIDVDTASYTNIRRYIHEGSLPPVGSIRIEEMINYFSYDYPKPDSGPFALSAEVGPAPWNPEHKLVKIGLQAKTVADEDIPPSNLVFLIDVSGSMEDTNKLPLLKQSMLMLVDHLGKKDRVSIVVYAGADRVVLPPTPGDRKEEIRKAIENLSSGGSTHGSSGIVTAYSLAEQVFMPKGNNRVILASDGDFNVGITGRGELQKLISKKRESGVYLTVLGFGMGNYQDDTMEILADSGNGNYAYIDSLLEAKKVLVKERASTLYALARDVKIQVEFNPDLVGAYRLIGYENRILADEDFKDDNKDAGEIGLGHTVTALYEIIPAGAADIPEVDDLKYKRVKMAHSTTGEIMTIKLRYKPLGLETSVLNERAVLDASPSMAQTSNDFRFSSSVAAFGMLLKDSQYLGEMNYTTLLELARNSRGKDDEGYRAEAIRLMEMAQLLQH